VRAQVGAGVGRAVARRRAVGRHVEGRVRLRARRGGSPRGDAVVRGVARLAGEDAGVAHAVGVFWNTLCAPGWERCSHYLGLWEKSKRFAWGSNRRRSRRGGGGRLHGFEALDDVVGVVFVVFVVVGVVLCCRRQGRVGTHGSEEGEYIIV